MSDRAQTPRVSRRALTLTAALLLLSTWPATAPNRAEAAWLPPVDISRAGSDATEPEVAVDSAGDAVVAWRRLDGANYVIETANRPAGGAWSAPLQLSAAGQNAETPQLALDAAGDAVAVWSRSNGSNYIVQSATMAGGGWGAPLDLSAPGADAKAPQVAVDGAGHFVAVWSRSTGPSTAVVQSATGVPGGAWSGQVDLSTSGRNDQPQIAVDPRGDAAAVWRHYEGGPTLIQSAMRPSGGAWEPALPVSPSSGTAERPHVALDATGRAVAVWRHDGGAGYLVESAQRPAGSWLPPVPLSASEGNAEAPQVAVDAAGNAVALWSRSTKKGGLSTTAIQAAVQSAGGAWQSPLDVSPAEELAEGPQVGFDAAGNAVAAWTSANANPAVVHSASRPPGGAWTPPLELSNPDRGAFEPQLAFDAEGNGVAVWSRYNGANTIIQASGYDGAGPHLAASIPTVGSVKRPVSFSVSALDAWSAIGSIAWTFGDRAAASGARVTHAFARPGTYTVTVVGADALGFTGAAHATIVIYPKVSAARHAPVRHGRALLRLHCPSTAGCTGAVKLIAGMKIRRGKHLVGKRVQIGRSRFAVPPKKTTTVPVPLTPKGLRLVRKAGTKGLRTQLTGPGVKHRIVVLLAP
jgi:PKD repeat protein